MKDANVLAAVLGLVATVYLTAPAEAVARRGITGPDCDTGVVTKFHCKSDDSQWWEDFGSESCPIPADQEEWCDLLQEYEWDAENCDPDEGVNVSYQCMHSCSHLTGAPPDTVRHYASGLQCTFDAVVK